MNEKEKEELTNLYNKRFDELGYNIKSVGWRSKNQQKTRFDILAQIGNLKNKKILDVGCGFGDFYKFLIEKNTKPKIYHGIDLSSNIISKANEIFKNNDNVILKAVSFKETENNFKSEEFDYVIASGIFNFLISDNYTYLKETIKSMFRICKIGVAINMTTDYVDYKDKNLFYFNPEKVFSFCKKITKRICLRHDYMPYEFTIYLYKKQNINEDNVFI